MSVTIKALYNAEMAFKASPQPATCAQFLSALREAEALDLITDDRFHDGLADVEAYLWKGGSIPRASLEAQSDELVKLVQLQ